MIVALGAQVVGQLAPGEIGVAVSDQQQVAIEPTATVERGSGFDGGTKLVLRTDERERGRSREKLGVRGWSKKFVGVEGVQRFSGGDRNYFNAPEAAGQVRRAEDACDTVLQRFRRSRHRRPGK